MGVSNVIAVLGLVVATSWLPQEAPEERIYGRVTTAGGSVLEGWLRWDRTDASWGDFLDGEKELPWEHLRDAELLDPQLAAERRAERSIEAFGVRITWDRDDEDPRTVSSSVRFGDLAALRVLDGRRALLRLKSGEEVILHASSSGLRGLMRGLVVEDRRGELAGGGAPDRGTEVGLRWTDIDEVEFMAAPDDVEPPSATRLHGTVRTRSGLELTGLVTWDRDEALTTDVLDGEDVDGRRDHEIEFGDIAALEWDSPRSTRVLLRDGTERLLGGTNDVDEDNRGIEVADPTLGRVVVHWEAFESLTLHGERARDGAYHAFDGGVPLRGTVRLRSGETRSGAIRWDNDEASSWEVLDGWDGDLEYDIELRWVLALRRSSPRSLEVVLRDGRVVELTGSNDVDRGNQGIFVTTAGGAVALVRWDELEELVLEW